MYKLIARSRHLQLALSLLLLQQAFVATGTYLMGRLAAEYPVAGLPPTQLALLTICLASPGTWLHYLVTWFTVAAQRATQKEYLTAYARINYGHPGHWRNLKSKEQRHNTMVREGQDAVASFIHFVTDATATTCNILFNLAAVSLVTNVTLSVAILAAGLTGLAIIHFRDAKIRDASDREILANNNLNAVMGRSWDNIVLGNRDFFSRWGKSFDLAFDEAARASRENVKTRDGTAAVAAIPTNLIVVLTALLLAALQSESGGPALAILIMLPRCMQTVNHFQVIQYLWAQSKYLRQRLAVTELSLAAPAQADLSEYMRPAEIKIQCGMSGAILSHANLLDAVDRVNAGRFTLRGPNGCGKSTFLASLKQQLGEQCVYLPAQHELELSEDSTSCSSGELALMALKDISSSRAPIILLDEWDANLSPENRISASAKIDELSATRLVIEVRHGHAG